MDKRTAFHRAGPEELPTVQSIAVTLRFALSPGIQTSDPPLLHGTRRTRRVFDPFEEIDLDTNQTNCKYCKKEQYQPRMLAALTAKQKEILTFIEKQVEICGCVPSQAEIRRYFGHKSPNATRQNLKLIEKKGYIQILPRVTRGIRLLGRSSVKAIESVPLIGRIAAGFPILAEENIEDWIRLPGNLFPEPKGRFALRVVGDSMTGAGILDGDIAVIRKQPTAEPGAIAAVRLGDEATLKRIEYFEHRLVLKAENPLYEDIEIRAESGIDPQIEGVLEGIVRTLTKGGQR